MKLPRAEALAILDGERGHIISDTITDNSRWSIHHELIVRSGENYYQAYYSVGATESQDESPWQYESEVEFTEVEPRDVTVTQYFPVAVKEATNG